MKNLVARLGVFALALAFASPASVSAQKARRIKLYKSRGESGAAVEGIVSGTVGGKAPLGFVFRARRGHGMDLNLDAKSGDVFFEIIAPNGKILIKDTRDFLDDAPTTGDYTARIYVARSAAAAGDKNKRSFRFSVFMYV